MRKQAPALMIVLAFGIMAPNVRAWDHPGHMLTAAVAFPELEAAPVSDPNAFEKWAKQSHQVAVDWAYDLKTLPDPNKDQPAEKLVQNMVNFILNGVSPVNDAPPLPAGYWAEVQSTSERQLTLAGYRIADLLVAAADHIESQRKFVGM